MILLKEIVIQPLPHHIKIAEKMREKWKDGKQINPDQAGKPRYIKVNGQPVYANGQGQNSTMIYKMKDYVMEQLLNESPITDFPIAIELEFHTTRNQIDYRMKNGVLTTPKNKAGKGRESAGWDIGNYWIWSKIFDDCLIPFKEPVRVKPNKYNTKYRGWKGLIPDDNVDYIRSTGKIIWVPIEDYNDRKLIFKIYKYD